MAVLYSQKAFLMFHRSLLMDLHSVYCTFRDRMHQILEGHETTLPTSVIIDDFFDICIHRSSDAVQFFDDAGTQRRHLDPARIHRVIISGHLQDIFFDEFSGYVFESNYFKLSPTEKRYIFVHNDISSICVHTVGEILRVIMGVVAQYPEGRMFFHPDNATSDIAMSDLIISPIPHRRDVEVTVRFE